MDSDNADTTGITADSWNETPTLKPTGFQFRCNLCDEEYFGIPRIINTRHQYVVDEECASEWVVPQILMAKANEYAYPPRWGNVVIETTHFLHLLPASFTKEYDRKHVEYCTPLEDRIYCRKQRQKDSAGLIEQCGVFLGHKTGSPEIRRQPYRVVQLRFCPVCNIHDRSSASCEYCGEVMTADLWTLWNHICKVVSDDDTTAFEGLNRGREYQICPGPGCGMVVQLAEACNALTCLSPSCRTSFCAICGRPAAHDSDHWQLGKHCPRWNHPDDANAGFDPLPDPMEIGPSPEWLNSQRLWQNELEIWPVRPWNIEYRRDDAYLSWLQYEFDITDRYSTRLWARASLDGFIWDLHHELTGHFSVSDDVELGIELITEHVLTLDLQAESPDEANLAYFRALLRSLRDALELVSLYRGIGRLLTRNHLVDLQSGYRRHLAGIMAVWEAVGEDFMLDHPRVVDIAQRIVSRLEWLVDNIRQQLQVNDDEALFPDDLDELEVEFVSTIREQLGDPDDMTPLRVEFVEVPSNLLEHCLRIYYELEDARKTMIGHGYRRPQFLGAAIDLFLLQHSNFDILKRFQEASSTDARLHLMARFKAQHHEIELQRRETFKDGPIGLPAYVALDEDLWHRTLDAYHEFAELFLSLIPSADLARHQIDS